MNHIKEEVELKIESIKIELDEIKGKFYHKLDQIQDMLKRFLILTIYF